MLCFRHLGLICVWCRVSQLPRSRWCPSAPGGCSQQSLCTNSTLISAATGAPLHPKPPFPPLSPFLFLYGLFPAHAMEEGAATSVHSWDFCSLPGPRRFFFSFSFQCQQPLHARSSISKSQSTGGWCTQITTTHQTAQMRNGQLSTGNEKSCVNIIKKTANATGEIINKKYICSFLPSEMRMGDGGFPS